MDGILVDSNVQQHVQILRYILESESWQEVWSSLALPILSFSDVELPRDATDSVVWHFCQQHELCLVTANRNMTGPDSLEATIRRANAPNSLPVFTLADPEQVRHSSNYAGRVAESLLEYLIDIDKYRGTGRLYLPSRAPGGV